MRLQSRLGFVIHRAFHRSLVRLQVWRNNRSVAEAFRDAEACDAIHRRRLSPQGKIMRVVLAIIAAGALAEWHYQRNGSFPRLSAATPQTRPPAEARTSASAPAPAAGAAKAVAGPAEAPRLALGSLASAAVPAFAAVPAPAKAQEPSGPLRFPSEGNVLLACKKDRTLYVYARKEGIWSRLAAFPMAIGRNAGDKGERGDARTPEGRFWITGMEAGPSKGPLYGALIFPLNYPRPSDRAEGKGGDGIWIHGVPAGTLPNFTHGCISLANDDVLGLSAMADAGTPVVILADSLGPDPAHQIDTLGLDREYPAIAAAYGRKTSADSAVREAILGKARAFVASERKRFPDLAMQSLSEAERKAILARLEKWRTDWSNRSVEAYASNYDPAFHDRQGRSKADFLERKARIFASKTRIQMEIRDPRIEAESYGRVRVSFRQEYLAEGTGGPQRSSENKTLRLDEGPLGWFIITE